MEENVFTWDKKAYKDKEMQECLSEIVHFSKLTESIFIYNEKDYIGIDIVCWGGESFFKIFRKKNIQKFAFQNPFLFKRGKIIFWVQEEDNPEKTEIITFCFKRWTKCLRAIIKVLRENITIAKGASETGELKGKDKASETAFGLSEVRKIERKNKENNVAFWKKLRKERAKCRPRFVYALIQFLFQAIRYIILGGLVALGVFFLTKYENIVKIALLVISVLLSIGFNVWYLLLDWGYDREEDAFHDEIEGLRLTKENLKGVTYGEAREYKIRGLKRARHNYWLGCLIGMVIFNVLYLGIAYAIIHLAQAGNYMWAKMLQGMAQVEFILIPLSILTFAIYLAIEVKVYHKDNELEQLIYKYSDSNCWGKCENNCKGLTLNIDTNVEEYKELISRGGSYSYTRRERTGSIYGGGVRYDVYEDVRHTGTTEDEYKTHIKVTRKCICQKCGHIHEEVCDRKKGDYPYRLS